MTMLQTLDSDLQRSIGKLALEIAASGAVVRRREEGSAKLRMPTRLADQASEAIIINTSGGLAGGDRLEIDVRSASDLCLTTQAAEKVYRALSNETRISTKLSGQGAAKLLWLPQETILFDGARLERSLEADLQENAGLLAVESVILGRKAMGESLTDFSFHDRWRIRRGGRLIYADDLRFDPARVLGAAALDGARAFATLVFVGAATERFLEPLREIFADRGGVSAWDGKLVARLVGVDGFDLRKTLIPALTLLAAPNELPKVWTL
ncbi:MAG TPA: urease accessory protein UreD [Aestuariivirga sp.]|nr:urease accessory protein UreD [Aestuariivirga sp.]